MTSVLKPLDFQALYILLCIKVALVTDSACGYSIPDGCLRVDDLTNVRTYGALPGGDPSGCAGTDHRIQH